MDLTSRSDLKRVMGWKDDPSGQHHSRRNEPHSSHNRIPFRVAYDGVERIGDEEGDGAFVFELFLFVMD